MKDKLKLLFEKLENAEITFIAAFWGFLGIVAVKVFLENFVNNTISGFAIVDLAYFSHFILWFAGVYLSVVLIVNAITGRGLGKVSKVVLFIYPTTWLIQIIDIIYYGSQAPKLAYLYLGFSDLARHFVRFGFGYHYISVGQQVGIAVFVLLLVLYLWSAGLGKLKSVLTGLLSALVLNAWGAAPSVVKFFINAFQMRFDPQEPTLRIVDYFTQKSLSDLLTSNIFIGNFLNSHLRTLEFATVGLFSQIFYVVVCVLAALWAYYVARGKFKAAIGNFRSLCIAHFYTMLALGMALATVSPAVKFDWVLALNMVVIFAVYYFVWMFAVGVNDIFDYKIDCMCNTNRPLVRQLLTKDDMKGYNFAFMILALLGGIVLGPMHFYLVAVGLALSYVYSAPPLRLKRVPMLALFIMAMASLTAVLAGFYLFNYSKAIASFPFNYLVAILVFYSLWGHIKDLKDVEGDRQDGVYTLANIVSEKKGKHIVGLGTLAGFLLMPLIIGENLLFIPAIPAGTISYYLCLKPGYKANALFSVYFGFLAASFLILLYF